MSPLVNARHEAFARAIVEGKSQRDAYRAAGYSPKTDNAADASASQLLSDAKVAARVAELKEAAADASVMTAREVLQELSKLGRASIQDVIVQGDTTADVVAALRDMAPEHAAAIQELTVEVYTEGGGEDAREVKRVKIKLHPKTSALELLGKHHKLFTEKHEHSDPDGRGIGSEAADIEHANDLETARRIAFALNAGARAAGAGQPAKPARKRKGRKP